jgi:chromosome segregation ATPase
MPSRIETDDDEDDFADLLDGSQNSTRSNSKGPSRTNGYDSERNSPSPEPESSRVDGFHSPRANLDEDDEDEDEAGPGEFSPGAIVRVKLTNFVTYESAEFFPGPNLNMVIGPNGTGKSSLVCAICLGLGWGPQHLGRASQVGEFVKHGMSDAFVEIELQGTKGKRNHVVRLRIIKDGNGREFWLDGKKTSLKNVQSLMKELSIQVDNLCQFLPQDKVSEFAALSPVDLLLHTQRAAAPAHMVEWHDSLKSLRKEQKTLDAQKEVDAENLQRLETRQQNLHAEVQRLQERIQVQEKVGLLKKTITFVEYKIAREQHDEYKRKKLDAQNRLKELETRIGPTLQSITEKDMYRGQINVVVNERKRAVKVAEGEADGQSRAIDTLTEEMLKNEQEVQAEVDSRKNRQRDIEKFQRKITDMKARLNLPPIEFDAAEWNERTVSISILLAAYWLTKILESERA